MSAMVILLMGVSGSGKTTVGQQLAADLHWQFQDGDDFHPAANIEKMRQGIPLSDRDRQPWLQALQGAIASWLQSNTSTVLACSALKAAYRQTLIQDSLHVKQVYLKGSFALLQQRLQHRQGHYMNAELLQSQFDALEEPKDAVWVEIDQPTEAIVAQIRQALDL